MLSHTVISNSFWLAVAGRTTPYSCCFMFARICFKQFSQSSIKPVAGKLPEKDRKGDNTEDLKTSDLRSKSSWVTMPNKFAEQSGNDITSNFSSSAHLPKSDSKRRWKARADIAKQLDKIKVMTNRRRKDSFKTRADVGGFGNSVTTGAVKRARNLDYAEVERCIEILSNQKERLEMFSKKPENVPVDSNHSFGYDTALDWWNQYTQRRMSNYSVEAPNNHYMEMLKWSEEGHLWSFPVNNEEGLEEEKDIPFYKHVFLEELLDDGFPKVGPVRKFMEAVIAGLSTNPYLTFKEKEEHINWFRDYFKEKKETLETLGAIGHEGSNAND